MICANLMSELEQQDATTFKIFMRMEPAVFREVLARVFPFWRKPLEELYVIDYETQIKEPIFKKKSTQRLLQ